LKVQYMKWYKTVIFYERTSVDKSRIDKFCNLCGNNIPKGSASNGAKLFCDGFYQVHFCKQCEETYKNELTLMYNSQLDDY
jgi:hypothetical protein